ncbi:cysteine--tRNA ligase [Candidatus Pacearchaeota archaeon]|nr:cysteine--tRNA ligase [Candidatus Pacearchaeota archaeon]
MSLKLYNTLSRKKERFIPINKKNVGIYTCGPTVYWYQHIGNLRSYIFSDILKRVLMYNNYKVKQIMNVTDVGHLTSDADSGDDKIEKAAKKEGKKAEDISNYYLKVFRDDFKKLNIIEPNKWTKATGHIKEQIELIKKLEKKGYTYKTKDGIYFNSSKLKDYGKLARLDIKGLQEGKRINLGEKKNKTDFALWKFSEKPGERQQEWKSPWGVGFPGWHIECSAMSMKYLGETFDIHTGGIDHIPIHHTNEIAQSEAATGEKFVNYWMHGNFLTFKGEKVSKSKGGLYTISELEEKGFSPLEYRYLCLTTHYRKPLNFTLENLESARNSYQRLKNIISEIKDDEKINEVYLKKFEKDINYDLNMPNALAELWDFIRDKKAKGKYQTIKNMDEVFGLDLLKKEKVEISKKVKELIKEREKARKEKDWKKADELRDKIKKQGYSLDDTKKGAVVKKDG